MRLMWNKTSSWMILLFVTILVLVLFYGEMYLVEPMKEEAAKLEEVVTEQKKLLAVYTPEEATLKQYEEAYQETQVFLPERENISDILITLEKAASAVDVTLNRVSSVSDPSPVEGLSSNYLRSSYGIEMTSESAENMRDLLASLNELERVWNVHSFRYEKSGENYTGTLMFELYYHTQNN